jgi:hypothetical protein
VVSKLLIAAVVVAAIAAWLFFGVIRRALFSKRIDRALGQMKCHRDAYRGQFLSAAAASGKPRGLAWKNVDFNEQFLLARDRANGDLVGLVGATISFEAVPGGGMEEVEAVGNLRAATAVFTHDGGDWTTQGRAVFNLEPREVLERYRDSLEPI